MIQIIDAFFGIDSLFGEDGFDIGKWERYTDSVYEGSASLFKEDLKDCLDSGMYRYETDVLPVINAVRNHPDRTKLHTSFLEVTKGLNERITACFGRTPEIDIVLCLGLCNGAGWVTTINGRNVILLGIEKILELNWVDTDSMNGLILHELGHAYHKQFGSWKPHGDQTGQSFIRQLFSEGIAMVFEQILVGDPRYFHQNKNGWLAWCDDHWIEILSDFTADYPTMTKSTQRYFGDWVSYNGWGDVGYYLGAKFVQYLCEAETFDQLIKKESDAIYHEFLHYTQKILQGHTPRQELS